MRGLRASVGTAWQHGGRIDTVKYRTGLHQADQPADPLNSALSVNIAGSHVRSVSHNVLYAVSIFFFLHSFGILAIIDRSIYGEWGGKPGDKITQTLNVLGIFASLFLFWSGTRKIGVTRFNRVLPLMAAGFLLISVLWSVDPRLTLNQGTVYFFVVLGAIGLVEALDGDELMDLAALICGLSAVASVVQFLIFPEPGDFRGVFSHKNLLGQAMAGGVLTALHGIRIRSGRRFRYICIFALCTIVGLMSKSATSVLTIIVFCWLDILGRLYLRGGPTRKLSIFLSIVSVQIAIVFVLNADLIFDLLGKDQTLTGRTLIWPYVIDNISEQPILGWGFHAFWSTLNPHASQISNVLGWMIPEAHNGILEFLLQIGLVGTLFFMFLWVRNFAMALKCMNGPARQFGLSSVLLLIGILVIGVSEEVLLSGQQFFTSLFFIMGCVCDKDLRLARAARRHVRARSGSAPLRNALAPGLRCFTNSSTPQQIRKWNREAILQGKCTP